MFILLGTLRNPHTREQEVHFTIAQVGQKAVDAMIREEEPGFHILGIYATHEEAQEAGVRWLKNLLAACPTLVAASQIQANLQ